MASPCVLPCAVVPARCSPFPCRLIGDHGKICSWKQIFLYSYYLLFILLPLYNLSRGDGVDAGGSGRRRAGCHCGVLSCGVLIGVPETTTPMWRWWGSPWAGGVGQKPSEKSDVGEGEEELQSFDCAEALLTWERFPTLKRSALDGGNHNSRPGRCRVVGGLCCCEALRGSGGSAPKFPNAS